MEMITLKSGIKIPVLGFGTDNISKSMLIPIIQNAIQLGYSLFDTATAYQNHAEIKKAFCKNQLICTKINNGDLLQNNAVETVVQCILDEFETTQIDFLLLHNPTVANYVETFKKLIGLKEKGVIKSIGVSNFTIKHLLTLSDVIEHVDINQIELHPFFIQQDLVSYCREKKITVMAYRPFAHGNADLLGNNKLRKIGEKYKKTTSQVILKWLIQQNHCVIPKASCENHLKKNIAIFDFKLLDEEIVEINSLDKKMRTCTGPWADFNE